MILSLRFVCLPDGDSRLGTQTGPPILPSLLRGREAARGSNSCFAFSVAFRSGGRLEIRSSPMADCDHHGGNRYRPLLPLSGSLVERSLFEVLGGRLSLRLHPLRQHREDFGLCPLQDRHHGADPRHRTWRSAPTVLPISVYSLWPRSAAAG